MGEKKKVVYILGPFDSKSGLDDYAAAEEMLTEMGYETTSRVFVPEGLDKAEANRIAVAMIDAADAVVALPGWNNDDEAVVDRHLAYCFDKPLADLKDNRDNPMSERYPPDIVKAWLKHDLEQVLGVSA